MRPSDVLEEFTSVRYQTQLKDGVVTDGSLHNMRVVNAGVVFRGKVEMTGGDERHLQAFALALRNLTAAGLKRNRGFGRIRCSMADTEKERALLSAALGEGVA